MARGRHVNHGNDIRFAALSISEDRTRDRADCRILSRYNGRRRSAGTPGLFVRQSAGNLVFTRWRGTYADDVWFGLSNDEELRGIRASVLQIGPEQRNRGRS